MIVVRTVMGLFGGVVFPAIAVLLAAWIPEKERGKLGSLAFSGSQVSHHSLINLIFINLKIHFLLF